MEFTQSGNAALTQPHSAERRGDCPIGAMARWKIPIMLGQCIPIGVFMPAARLPHRLFLQMQKDMQS